MVFDIFFSTRNNSSHRSHFLLLHNSISLFFFLPLQPSTLTDSFDRKQLNSSNQYSEDQYFFEDVPEIENGHPAFARDGNGHFNNEWNEFRDMVPSFSMYKNVRVRIVAADCV